MAVNLERYEVKYGKWGAFIYDTLNRKGLPLEDIVKLLNEYNLKKLENLGEALGGPER